MSARAGRWWWVVAVIALTSPLGAQEATTEPLWSATVYYDAVRVASSPDGAYWHTLNAGVARRLPGGSVALQGLTTTRFDATDRAIVADVYHDLWGGAYGNIRAAVAPGAEVLSRIDVGAEIFQTVGAAEIAGSFRHQEFEVTEVNTLGAGLGLYSGDWYLRPRTVVANVEESWSPFVAFTARRYVGGSTDNLLDLSAGFGREVLEVAPSGASNGSLDVITSGSRFAGVRVQRFFTPLVGLSAGGWYSAYMEIPNRWGASFGLLTRW